MSSDYKRIIGVCEDPGRGARGGDVAALRELYTAYIQDGGVNPGQIVRWKPGLRPQWGMEYRKPAIVLRAPEGQREVCIGYIESDGVPSISWTDPNRLESFA